MNYVYGDGCTNSFFIDNKNDWNIFVKKGTSIYDLLNQKNNQMRENMLKVKDKNVNIMFFILGQIDIFYDYYKFKFVENKKINTEKLIEDYIILLNNIEVDNKKKIVCSVLPMNAGEKEFSQKVRNKYYIKNLNKYQMRYFTHSSIYSRRINFNNLLKKYCKIYKIKYINLDKELLDKDNRLKKKFFVKNRYSLHFIFEYQQNLITKKLKNYGIKEFKIDKEVIKKFLT